MDESCWVPHLQLLADHSGDRPGVRAPRGAAVRLADMGRQRELVQHLAVNRGKEGGGRGGKRSRNQSGWRMVQPLSMLFFFWVAMFRNVGMLATLRFYRMW